nr:putative RNA-dependent RNA polymerase [Poaceae Liege partitivirus 12]
MFTFLSSYAYEAIDWSLKRLGLRDPHNFQYSLKFIGYSEAKPIYPRNDAAYTMYQNIVKSAIRKNYPRHIAEHVIHDYHHPVATLETIVDTLKLSDKPAHTIPKDKKLIRLIQEAATAGLPPDSRMSFDNLQNVVFKRVREFMHQIKRMQITNPSHLYPQVTIHTKPALSTVDKVKVQVIAGVSKLHMIPSAQRFWPLFRYWIESRNSPMLWGYETLLGGMQKLHSTLLYTRLFNETFIAVDWPNYDLEVLFDERKRCYDCHESYFDFDHGYIPTRRYSQSNADPAHLRAAWNYIVSATKNMPIVLPDGSTYLMNDEFWFVYSGLFQTQSDDSIINHARLLTILSKMGFNITRHTRLKVQGDDSVIKLIVYIPADQHEAFRLAFQRLAKHYFNTEVRSEKIEVNNDGQVEVLDYRNCNGYSVRDEIKLLAMLLHPRSNPDHSTLMAKCAGFRYAPMGLYPRLDATTRTIWTQMEQEGITPAAYHIQRNVILQGESTFTIPTDRLPTLNEVTHHLRLPYERTLQDSEFYFPVYTPESHFLDVY